MNVRSKGMVRRVRVACGARVRGGGWRGRQALNRDAAGEVAVREKLGAAAPAVELQESRVVCLPHADLKGEGGARKGRCMMEGAEGVAPAKHDPALPP
jgi:hypothetical protein